jgi:hypothetical protein
MASYIRLWMADGRFFVFYYIYRNGYERLIILSNQLPFSLSQEGVCLLFEILEPHFLFTTRRSLVLVGKRVCFLSF